MIITNWIFRFKSAPLPLVQGIVFRKYRAVLSGTESTFVFA